MDWSSSLLLTPLRPERAPEDESLRKAEKVTTRPINIVI